MSEIFEGMSKHDGKYDIESVMFDGKVKLLYPNQVTLKGSTIGDGVQIGPFVNIYGADIKKGTRIGSNIEIQRGVTVGENCKISSHSFLCEGVTIDDQVFIGHGVIFTNDNWPAAVNAEDELKADKDWKCLDTRVKHHAMIGSGVRFKAGITIGSYAVIGLGSVVTKDIPEYAVAYGSPAKVKSKLSEDDIKAILRGKVPTDYIKLLGARQ